MYSIAKREFLNIFKSFKSILIILIFLFAGYYISKYFSQGLSLTPTEGNNSSSYASGIRGIVTLLGFLFVFTLSHDTMSKEKESNTIRFLVTKTSRSSILLGKYFGILLFWIFTVGISMLVVMFVAKKILIFEYSQLIFFLSYAISLNVIVSTFCTRTTYSMFIGILLGLLIPILGIWSILSEDWILKFAKYILPYTYILNQDWRSAIPILFSILFMTVSIYKLKREDL